MKANPDEALARWEAESREWQAIKDELLERGDAPSAFDVSDEQRRRMQARGERPMLENEADRRALGFSPRRAKYLERRAHLRRVK